MTFSLEKFEAFAYGRDHEGGMRELLALLEGLDNNYGSVGSQFEAKPLNSILEHELNGHINTRIAAATSCLLSDHSLQIAPQWRQHILALHRWLSLVFAASPFHNADHVMRALNIQENKADLSQFGVDKKDLLKFCLLYMPESEVSIELEALWEADHILAASLCLVLISPRFLGAPLAHSKREQILPWLTEKLGKIEDIEDLPIGVLHDLYMHCSYADRADKHDIKKPINALIRKKLNQHGLTDLQVGSRSNRVIGDKGKPVMLVVLEWFGSSHSIYRTHSRTMESARRHFKVVAMAFEKCVDDVTRQVFDEVIHIENGGPVDHLRQIQNTANELNAQICYMPSVGMFPLTMWLANLRVAPLQVMALGHPATTHAHAIDYVAVEEDYVGNAECFSEKLLILPKDGMPYRPSASAKKPKSITRSKDKSKLVKIAVCSTTMKLNPGFLQACCQIVERSNVPIHFQFLVGQAQGLVHPYVQRVVRMFLGDHATVFPHQAYREYMEVIQNCDMFINPFPFGNTNGIIDTVSAGLVGVCKTGAEVHEHIDQGLFERLGLPSWLVAKSVDEYIAAAVKLAENHEERIRLSKEFSGWNKTQIIFKGRPEIFGDLLRNKVLEK